MKIGIDCDDVLRDFVPKCLEIYNKKYNTNATLEQVTEWTFDNVMPEIKDKIEFFLTNAKELFYDTTPRKDFINLPYYLKEHGHDVAIVTHQLKGIEDYTCQWLKKYNVPYDSLHFSNDKSLINLDVLVDDGLHNLNNLNHKKTMGLCVERPWNNNNRWEGIYVNNTDDVFTVIDMLPLYKTFNTLYEDLK